MRFQPNRPTKQRHKLQVALTITDVILEDTQKRRTCRKHLPCDHLWLSKLLKWTTYQCWWWKRWLGVLLWYVCMDKLMNNKAGPDIFTREKHQILVKHNHSVRQSHFTASYKHLEMLSFMLLAVSFSLGWVVSVFSPQVDWFMKMFFKLASILSICMSAF